MVKKLGEKETPLGEKVTKVGEKVNFVGEKKYIVLAQRRPLESRACIKALVARILHQSTHSQLELIISRQSTSCQLELPVNQRLAETDNLAPVHR